MDISVRTVRCVKRKEKRKQFGWTSWTPLLDFHNELSVISQCATTFICPDSSQPPPFINPFSPLRHAPPTPHVVYHVWWNRVSLAVNLGNGVTSETPGTLCTNLGPHRSEKWWRFSRSQLRSHVLRHARALNIRPSVNKQLIKHCNQIFFLSPVTFNTFIELFFKIHPKTTPKGWR